MKEDLRKLILLTISVSKAINDLSDIFFKQKLSLRLFKLIESYFEFIKESDVAQYNRGLVLLNRLDGLSDDADYIIHSGQYSAYTPLLYLQQKTLELKLLLLKDIKNKKPTGEKEVPVPKLIPSKPKNKLSSSQEKIVDFIKKSDKIRAKDIVEKFNFLSERTIKRTLKDLTELGVLKREEADRAVYYSL